MWNPSQGLDHPGRVAATHFSALVGQSKSALDRRPNRSRSAGESGLSRTVAMHSNQYLRFLFLTRDSWLPGADRRRSSEAFEVRLEGDARVLQRTAQAGLSTAGWMALAASSVTSSRGL